MKKLISLMLCLVLTAMLAVPALADAIWEPTDDFLWEHYDECYRANADYEAQEDAVIQNSPEDDGQKGLVPAEETVHVMYLWENWGYIDENCGMGWVELTRFRRLFGAEDFAMRFGEEFAEEEGVIALADYEQICVWTYPGSGNICGVMDGESYSWSERDPYYDTVWTDELGARWCRLDYYYGMRGWICLDDPAAEEYPALFPRYADEIEEPQETEDPAAETEDPAGETESPALERRPAPVADELAVSVRNGGLVRDVVTPDHVVTHASSGRTVLVICLVVAVVAVTAIIAITAVLKKKAPRD
ncbi:MAG: hypothetical protein IKD79_05340 [Oscillospiraceae bacterium]|nr:hypothetical protein [Oscillospiraceae bacterium]